MKWLLATLWFLMFQIGVSQTKIIENQSYELCGKEIKITEIWVHQHQPYVSMIFENQTDTFSLTYGVKIPSLPCDMYVDEIHKVGDQPATVTFASKLSERKTLNVINSIKIKPKRLYDINGLLVSFVKNGKVFQFTINEKDQFSRQLKEILWLGQNAFSLFRFQDNELTLVRLVEMLQFKGEILYQLAEEEIKAESSIVQQILLMPKVHCTKGENKCSECKKIVDMYQICLVKVYLEPISFTANTARFIVNGKENNYPYSIVKVFSTKTDALKYAKEHNITEIFLD